MQSAKRKRYPAKTQTDWMPYVMVLLLGVGIGSYATHQFLTQMHPVVHAFPKPHVHAKKNAKPKEEGYDFYAILSNREASIAPKAEGFILQLGVFQAKSACQTLAKRLTERGYGVHQFNGAHMCRVYVGPFTQLTQAYQVQRGLLKQGYRSLLRKHVNS